MTQPTEAAAAAAKAEAEAKAALWAQAVAVPSVKALVPITLDLNAGNYMHWRGLFEVALCKYALEDHIAEATTSNPDNQWKRLDALVRSWLYGAISVDIAGMVMDTSATATAYAVWTAIEGLYRDNADTRAVYLEQEFYSLQQGVLSMTDYCKKQKALAAELSAVGTTILDKGLVLNTLRGLNKRFRHMRTLISMQKPLPSFNETRSALILEELSSGTDSDPPHMAFVAANSSSTKGISTSMDRSGSKPHVPPSNRRPEACRNFARGNCRFGDKCRFLHTSSQQQRTGNNSSSGKQATSPWPSIQNPWAGSIQMWPGQGRPAGHGILGAPPTAAPHAFHAAAPTTTPPQCMPPWYGTQWSGAAWQPTTYGGAPSTHPYSFDQNQLMGAFNTMTLSPPSPSQWYMDSGASAHMTSDQGNLSRSFVSSAAPSHVIVGNGSPLPITYTGSTTLSTPSHSFNLNNVLVTPHIIKNLISVRHFTIDNQCSVEFDPFGLSVKDLRTRNVILRYNSHGDLYPFPSTSTAAHALSATTSPSTLWHRRLGHLSKQALSHLARAFSIPCNQYSSSESICHACQLGKHVRLPFDISTSRATTPFELLHCDIWTSPLPSFSGYKYYLVVLDDFTHYLWTFPLRHKSDTYSTLTNFFAYASTQFGAIVKSLQCDNGGEFDNTTSRLYFLSKGMHLRMSCPHTSQQNGKAERAIRTINNMVRSLLFQASMPPIYWVEALHTSTHLLNLHPTKTLRNQTPHEYLHKTPPQYADLRVFGCLCYPNLSATAANKLAPRSTACVFLGYPSNHKGYRCLDLTTNRIIISRHVVFDESSFPFSTLTHVSADDLSFLDEILFHTPPAIIQATTTPNAPVVPVENEPTQPPAPPLVLPPTAVPIPPVVNDHSMSTRGKQGYRQPQKRMNLHVSTLSPIPRTYRAALNDEHWRLAMQQEFDALHANNTWDLVPRPPGSNLVTGKWLFRHKFKPDGSLDRYKARWVLRGFSQRPGIDFGETFSPVVKPATVRVVLTLALANGWPVNQLDINNAFLNGTLSETVYCQQPSGFVDTTRPDHVCRLNRSLYGLKQAPRAWFSRIATFLVSMGFNSSKADPSLFIYRQGTDDMAYLLLYVDDIVLTASSTTLLRRLIDSLHREFSLKDLGELHHFLGVSVLRTTDGFFLSQRQYTEDILTRAGMINCKSCTTPVDTSSKLASTGPPVDSATDYRSIAGALQYLTFTRPDITYAVQQACLHMHDPREPHANLLKRILRYLKGTLDHGLQLHRTSVVSLTAYTDADWAGCPDTRKSTSGYGVFLGDNLVSWSSKRQQTVSRSSAEAEYRAVANAVAESCWLRQLLAELHRPLRQATVVFCDNISAVYLSTNPVQHQRTKHVEIDLHFVRERVALGDVRVLHVPTSSQYADIFTKGLPTTVFREF
jgi:hypothetical protein